MHEYPEPPRPSGSPGPPNLAFLPSQYENFKNDKAKNVHPKRLYWMAKSNFLKIFDKYTV